jgi:hypothetical protein
VAGFCDPKRDVSAEDLSLWLASSDTSSDRLDDDQAIFILENLRFDFDQMLKHERLAVETHEGEGNPITTTPYYHHHQGCQIFPGTIYQNE